MSFPLADLTRLLHPARTVLGVVVAVDGATAQVATERGLATARTLDAVAVGDRVMIENGIAIKAPVARQVFPV